MDLAVLKCAGKIMKNAKRQTQQQDLHKNLPVFFQFARRHVHDLTKKPFFIHLPAGLYQFFYKGRKIR